MPDAGAHTEREPRALEQGEEPPAWLRAAAEEEIRRKQPRTTIRSTRLRPDEAERVERMAEQAGLDVASFIRLMLVGERPDLHAYASALREVYALVRRMEAAATASPPDAEAVREARAAVERLLHALPPPEGG